MPRAKPSDPSLGKAVRRARVSAGLSQAQLAERVEVAVETISRMERGAMAPSVAVLVRIADVLEVALDELARARVTPKNIRRDPAEVRRIMSLLRGLDADALALVHRGLQAFLGLRARPTPRRKPTAR